MSTGEKHDIALPLRQSQAALNFGQEANFRVKIKIAENIHPNKAPFPRKRGKGVFNLRRLPNVGDGGTDALKIY